MSIKVIVELNAAPGRRDELKAVMQGLVADLVQGGWVRAVFGYTRTGQVRRGWVQLIVGRIEY